MLEDTEKPAWIRRRRALQLGLGGVAASLVDCRNAAAGPADIPTQQLGVITGNDLKLASDWQHWLGRAADHVLLFFNQESWAALEQSINYMVGLGKGMIGQGRRVQWSVPVGGPHAYADVAAGAHDATYEKIARAILSVTPQAMGRIGVRMPWEFNLATQSLAARDASGRWDTQDYVAAFRRMVGLFRRYSDRFYFDWCFNIGQNNINPEQCYPGDDVVSVVSLDVYYQKKFDEQGYHDGGMHIFYYRKSQPYGLDWLARFAQQHGKLIGISEWGVDDNSATEFTRLMTEWIKSQGARLSHHNYWDRSDGIDARLSDNHLPALGAVYRKAFG